MLVPEKIWTAVLKLNPLLVDRENRTWWDPLSSSHTTSTLEPEAAMCDVQASAFVFETFTVAPNVCAWLDEARRGMKARTSNGIRGRPIFLDT